MRAVLYANDMEPITVIEVSRWAWEFLERNRQIRLPVMEPISFAPLTSSDDLVCLGEPRIVRITAEQLIRNGGRALMLFTSDEESALLLKSAFLPGQLGGVDDVYSKGMAQGFLKAMAMLGQGEE